MSERVPPTVTTADGATLALGARLGAGARGGAVIAPPHPQYGGESGNPVVLALEAGLARAGIAALCFDFRGAGGSEGVASGRAEDADADYRAALQALAARRPEPYLCAGYSFGAAAALRVGTRDPRVTRLLLVAPPLAMLDLPALRGFTGETTVLVGDDDAFAPLASLERALAGMPRVRLRVLAGEDHFFSGGAEALVPLVSLALLPGEGALG